jgi:AsmA protein
MRARSALKVAAIAAGSLVGLPAIAVGVLALRFDLEAYKPEIVAAVRRATGREIAITGGLHVRFGLSPRIEASDVTLANIPGGSRPAMASIDRIEARIALLPLLRREVVVETLHVVRPEILLETDTDGRPNWRFVPEARPKPAGAPASQPEPSAPVQASASPPRRFVRAVQIDDGALVWRDGQTGRQISMGVRNLVATADSADAPVAFALTAAFAGTDIRLTGSVGPLARLRPDLSAPQTPWPVEAHITALGADATVAGTIDDPAHPGAYTLAVTLTAPDLAALSPLAAGFAPGLAFPHAAALNLRAKVAGEVHSPPRIEAFSLSAGPTDLTPYLPGLALTRLAVAAPSVDKPVHAEAAGTYAGTAFDGSADLGAPASLLAAETAPLPIAATVSSAGAHFKLAGVVAAARTLTGLDLRAEAAIPDLQALEPLIGRRLPALKGLAVSAHLGDAPGGLRSGVQIGALHVTYPGTDATADLTAIWRPRPALRGRISAESLGLPPLPTGPKPAEQAAAAPSQSPALPAAPAPARPAPPPAQRRLFSDRPLPFATLSAADADLDLAAATVAVAGDTWRNLHAHLSLVAGRLVLDPVAADLPGGHLTASFTADAAQPAAPVHLVLQAPGIAAAPLLALLHLPPVANGPVEIDADLSGTGTDASALAATADGHLGLAIVGGSIDMRGLALHLADVFRRARLPTLVPPPGPVDLRCFAARLDLVHGLATLRALALDATLVTLWGEGTANLADETLALRLHPTVTLGRFGAAVPVDVTGSILAPRFEINARAGGGEPGRAGVPRGLGAAAGVVIGALGADHGIAGAEGASCEGAIASARGGHAGPPVPAPEMRAPGRSRAADILRRLIP